MTADGTAPELDASTFTDDEGTEWVPVATERELRRRKRALGKVAGQSIAIFLVDDTVYAFQNTCIHKRRHLIKGTLLGNRVICPGHQWAFDLDTGYERTQDACQPTFPARIENEHVYVVPEPQVLVQDTTWTPGLNR